MSKESGHWYDPLTATPRYEIEKKDGSGMRPTTLADARKKGWVPSSTTILKLLAKPQLQEWLIRNAVNAVVTAPDIPGEGLDAKITRVLETERQQDQESQLAMDRGTAIHKAIEDALAGNEADNEIWPWCAPAYKEISQRGRTLGVETVVIGEGYGGRVDLIQEGDDVWIWDWKSAKTLPKKGAWSDHILQASSYAAAFARRGTTGDKRIRTGNVYISTVEQGEFTVCEHGDWQQTYEQGFKPLVKLWQFINDYAPCA